MKIGIMSDSHGRIEAVRSALSLLDEAGVEAVVHCGDVGGFDVLEELAGRRAWFVWGNTDYPSPAWRGEIETLGFAWPEGPLSFTLAGRRIAVFHGHERAFGHAVREASYDYLLHGHTHKRDDYRIGGMRVINPGALHRASVRSVATLDLAADDLTFIEL